MLGQYWWTRAIHLAPTSAVVPFQYLSLIWAMGFGFALWGDVPTIGLIIGSVIVVGSGICSCSGTSRGQSCRRSIRRKEKWPGFCARPRCRSDRELQFVAKQYSRPSPPVLLRSSWVQPPPGPRDGCDAFHDIAGGIVVAGPAGRDGRPSRRRSCCWSSCRRCGLRPPGRPAVGLRAGQDVVPVRRIAAAVDRLALLVQRGLLGQVVAVAVQIGDALGDHRALGVLPRAVADAILGVHGVRALRAEIGAPGLAGRAGGLREPVCNARRRRRGRRDRRRCPGRRW